MGTNIENYLVRGPFDFWGGGERVKSAGEPEGRTGELWGSTPRPMIGSTMSGKLGFTCAVLGEI